MSHPNSLLAAMAAAALYLPASEALSASTSEAAGAKPSVVQVIEGSKLRRVTLTERAAQRLDIQSGQVGTDASGSKFVPYAAILYDLAGDAWVYTVPAPLTYVRHGIVVEQITGDHAYLRDGPPAGTEVVTVGVAQLYGAEKGVGH